MTWICSFNSLTAASQTNRSIRRSVTVPYYLVANAAIVDSQGTQEHRSQIQSLCENDIATCAAEFRRLLRLVCNMSFDHQQNNQGPEELDEVMSNSSDGDDRSSLTSSTSSSEEMSEQQRDLTDVEMEKLVQLQDLTGIDDLQICRALLGNNELRLRQQQSV